MSGESITVRNGELTTNTSENGRALHLQRHVMTEASRRRSVAGKMRTGTTSLGKSVSIYPECGANSVAVGFSRKPSETSHTVWAKFEEL
jgi:hypothetical protein